MSTGTFDGALVMLHTVSSSVVGASDTLFKRKCSSLNIVKENWLNRLELLKSANICLKSEPIFGKGMRRSTFQ